MVPPNWMIEELERLRREREDLQRPQLRIEPPEPLPTRREREPAGRPREPIVIDLWG